MQTLSPTLLRELAMCDAPICVSLYMEMSAGGGEHDHIRIALKNAKSEAAAALASTGEDEQAVSDVQQRLEALRYDDVAGGHDRRVAAFIAPDRTHIVDARFIETSVHVGPRFRLAPLLAHLEQIPDHAVLVASSDNTCLYRNGGGKLSAQNVPDLPSSLADITKFTDQQEKGNIHGREDSGIPSSYRGGLVGPAGPAGPTGVPHHSMGGHDWREDHENDLRSYANAVINAVQHYLSGTNIPLVIVADERLHGMIRANSEYPFVVAEGITRHPDSLGLKELGDLAAGCLHREVAALRDEAWDKVAMSLGRGDNDASVDPADIIAAAASGRVAHLFVKSGAALRGHVDGQTFSVTIEADGSDDLIDRAIADTLRNGGDVFPMDDRGGDDWRLAASYRYPL